MTDSIIVSGLELAARVGITAAERATPQRLTASLVIEPTNGFASLGDEIARTVDYFEVCGMLKSHAEAGEWNLIETVAEEFAHMVLERFGVRAVEVEVRKFILSDTRHVAVRLRREARL